MQKFVAIFYYHVKLCETIYIVHLLNFYILQYSLLQQLTLKSLTASILEFACYFVKQMFEIPK